MAGEYYLLRSLMEGLPKKHQGYPLLCMPSSEDPRDYQYGRLISGSLAAEPAVIDFRTNLPPVFDQGQRGSCVACASAWTLKAYEEIKQGDYPPGGLSVAFLYSMCKSIDGMPGQDGTTPRAAMKILQKVGICGEAVMPYSTLTDLPAPETPVVKPDSVTAAAVFRIRTYAALCNYSDYDRSQVVAAMRQALQEQGPFIMALLVCENFEPNRDGILPLPKGEVRGGHAVGIAGDLPEIGAFILRNSWGSGWGVDGYAYLPYEWVTHKFDGGWYVFEAWTAVDMSVAKPASLIEIAPGIKTMQVDGKEMFLEQAPVVNNNRLMVPVRDLASAMGYNVSWYGRKLVLKRPT